jgi:hypothetical protein
MSLLYGLSVAFNLITVGAVWYILSRCEKDAYIKRKLNSFLQALFYDGE